jgi:putative Mg2+ transporter-C (MgtC) family protein
LSTNITIFKISQFQKNVMFYSAEAVMLVPVLVAAIFGSLIGIERESRHKPAGIGTNVLICAGACIFTLLSVKVDPLSPSRIASNILTGVGFIGAGLILKEADGSIHGLTTAAGIWMAAAVGMAIGFHYYLLATVGTLLAVFAPRLPDWSRKPESKKEQK